MKASTPLLLLALSTAILVSTSHAHPRSPTFDKHQEEDFDRPVHEDDQKSQDEHERNPENKGDDEKEYADKTSGSKDERAELSKKTKSGTYELKSEQLIAKDETLCGEVRIGKHVPGKLLNNGKFLAFQDKMKALKKKAKKAKNKKQAEKLMKKALRMRKLHKKGFKKCKAVTPTDTSGNTHTETPTTPTLPGTGSAIVEDNNPTFPNNNSALFTTAYRAYIEDKLIFSVAVAQGQSKAAGLYAAHIGLEYLDNNEDGKCDNPLVCQKLAEHPSGAVLYFTSSQESKFSPWPATQALYPEDVEMSSVVNGRGTKEKYDLTLEEVLHYLTDNGWSKAYPEVFGAHANSTVGRLISTAIREKHYDPTKTGDTIASDFSTTVPETLYWVISSAMGTQDYPWRIPEVKPEWKSYNRALLQSNVPQLLALYDDPQYLFPKKIPDGNYTPHTLAR